MHARQGGQLLFNLNQEGTRYCLHIFFSRKTYLGGKPEQIIKNAWGCGALFLQLLIALSKDCEECLANIVILCKKSFHLSVPLFAHLENKDNICIEL